MPSYGVTRSAAMRPARITGAIVLSVRQIAPCRMSAMDGVTQSATMRNASKTMTIANHAHPVVLRIGSVTKAPTPMHRTN